MRRLVLSAALLLAIGAAHAQGRPPAPAAQDNPPPSALDGQWRGTSDGGSCNAPLDYQLTIEDGFVDGSAYDTTARGPVPNQRHAPAPAPTPGLWQIHGFVRSSGGFPLIAVASVRGTDRREGTLTARGEGGALVVTETGGCRRTARLSRSGKVP